MLDFKTLTFSFDAHKGEARTDTRTAVFDSRVNKVECAIQGFNVQYTGADHHLQSLFVIPHVAPPNFNTVDVTVDYLLRDNSGDIDDLYEGVVKVLVIVDRV
jgi:hypothetical protein